MSLTSQQTLRFENGNLYFDQKQALTETPAIDTSATSYWRVINNDQMCTLTLTFSLQDKLKASYTGVWKNWVRLSVAQEESTGEAVLSSRSYYALSQEKWSANVPAASEVWWRFAWQVDALDYFQRWYVRSKSATYTWLISASRDCPPTPTPVPTPAPEVEPEPTPSPTPEPTPLPSPAPEASESGDVTDEPEATSSSAPSLEDDEPATTTDEPATPSASESATTVSTDDNSDSSQTSADNSRSTTDTSSQQTSTATESQSSTQTSSSQTSTTTVSSLTTTNAAQLSAARARARILSRRLSLPEAKNSPTTADNSDTSSNNPAAVTFVSQSSATASDAGQVLGTAVFAPSASDFSWGWYIWGAGVVFLTCWLFFLLWKRRREESEGDEQSQERAPITTSVAKNQKA